MKNETRINLLHTDDFWRRCPMTWDASIVEYRAQLQFEPADRDQWLSGPHVEMLLNTAVIVLLDRRMLGAFAAQDWATLIDYWCACFLAPCPYSGDVALEKGVTLPSGYGHGAKIRVPANLVPQLGLGELPPLGKDAVWCRSAPGDVDLHGTERRVTPSWIHAVATDYGDAYPSHALRGSEITTDTKRRAWKQSIVYKQLQKDQGVNPDEDKQLTARARKSSFKAHTGQDDAALDYRSVALEPNRVELSINDFRTAKQQKDTEDPRAWIQTYLNDIYYLVYWRRRARGVAATPPTSWRDEVRRELLDRLLER